MVHRGFTVAALVFVGLTGVAQAELLWGLTMTDELVQFDTASPAGYTFARFITGLQTNEHLLDIDVNPNTGVLYGLSSQNRIYVIDTAANAGGAALAVVLSGTGFGIDWNPVANTMQVASNTQQSFHVTPPSTVTLDPSLTYAPGDIHAGTLPNVTDLAYNNNFTGATSTTLFGLDNLQNTLVTVDPGTGQVHTIGILNSFGSGPNGFTGANGFEISPSTVAYAALQLFDTPGSQLYRIDLATGHATAMGRIGGGGSNDLIIGIASVPEPASMTLLGAGALALLARRRRKSA